MWRERTEFQSVRKQAHVCINTAQQQKREQKSFLEPHFLPCSKCSGKPTSHKNKQYLKPIQSYYLKAEDNENNIPTNNKNIGKTSP